MYDKAELVIRQVALSYGVPVRFLTTKGKKRGVMAAKKEARRRLREEVGLSWSEVNMFLGYSMHHHRL